MSPLSQGISFLCKILWMFNDLLGSVVTVVRQHWRAALLRCFYSVLKAIHIKQRLPKECIKHHKMNMYLMPSKDLSL